MCAYSCTHSVLAFEYRCMHLNVGIITTQYRILHWFSLVTNLTCYVLVFLISTIYIQDVRYLKDNCLQFFCESKIVMYFNELYNHHKTVIQILNRK